MLALLRQAGNQIRACRRQDGVHARGASSGARQIRCAESHCERNVERRDHDRGICTSGEVIYVTAPEYSRQALTFNPSIPSFAIMGTIMRAAAGSAHHKPRMALSSNPTSKIAER